MKNMISAGLLALVFSATLLRASNAPQKGFPRATIVNVEKQELENPPYASGDNPSDATLHSEFYQYDVKLRTDCGVYESVYQSPVDFLPHQIAADAQLPVRLTKHVIYFELAGDRELPMHLVRRKWDQPVACSTQSGNR